MRATNRTISPTAYRLAPTEPSPLGRGQGEGAAYRLPLTTYRSGISLLEVLICIGVVAIGLVSIAALIPVGGMQVQRANIEERKGTLGLNAFREFQIRGMDKVENWVRYDGTNWTSYRPLSLNTVSNYPDFPYLPPVAIDPMMVAVGQSAGTSAVVSTFPANYSVGPRIPRLTLNSLCSIGGSYVPDRTLSDAVCTAADDVLTNIPDDVGQIGTTTLDSTGNKREFNGLFTWLATLTPNFPNTIPSGGSIPSPQPSDQYTLSIVVFDRRLLFSPVVPYGDGGTETMIQAHWSNGSATADSTANTSGEFTLVDSDTNAFAKLNMVHTDQWIMLTRYLPYASGSPPWIEAKWYRIVSVGDIVQSGSTYSRQVTLDGPDWGPDPTAANTVSSSASYIPPTSVAWPTSVSAPIPASSQNYNTYACVFDGAVGVFQKVIHLESPSNWSQ